MQPRTSVSQPVLEAVAVVLLSHGGQIHAQERPESVPLPLDEVGGSGAAAAAGVNTARSIDGRTVVASLAYAFQ
jgi:hypothetical protein